jgi:hypothetical protein
MAMMMKTALLWINAQRVVSILYRRFGKTCRFEDGTDRFSRNVVKKLPLLAAS